MRIALVAGEVSGDILGSRLIKALNIIYPRAVFEGIGGEQMLAAGMHVYHPMSKLSVMGFAEVLPRLRELLAIRKHLVTFWTENPPDLFIGIDAPDFNFKLEQKLSRQGITTCHYVSPSIWAWREGRIDKMRGSLDLMLTLLPFEVDYYQQRNIRAEFVGHPLADEIPHSPDPLPYREQFNIPKDAYVLAVLPGSRHSEIKYLGADFIQAVCKLHQQYPDWHIVIPVVNDAIKQEVQALIAQYANEVPIQLINQQSREVMMAADQVLMASGTAVLEGALIGRPMVAAYRVAPLTAKIIRGLKMIKSKYYTLPNNLVDKLLVPEYIQEEITVENLLKAVTRQHEMKAEEHKTLMTSYHNIHQQLKQNASQQAARAIQELLENKPV